MKQKLNNKKGFTLVELIVVIVIILILAAVLVPNVMRYIGQAREATFQSEASTYLTELQGYAAEYYAKNGVDLPAGAAMPTGYTLTNFKIEGSGGSESLIISEPGTYTALYQHNNTREKAIRVAVDKGAVTAFSYATKTYWVTWEQSSGWSDVKE